MAFGLIFSSASTVDGGDCSHRPYSLAPRQRDVPAWLPVRMRASLLSAWRSGDWASQPGVGFSRCDVRTLQRLVELAEGGLEADCMVSS